jgi:hypothetical protein
MHAPAARLALVPRLGSLFGLASLYLAGVVSIRPSGTCHVQAISRAKTVPPARRLPRSHSEYTRRKVSTFSCDIPYSDRPAASRASA